MDRISENVSETSDDFEYEDNEDSGTKIDCCKEQADPVKYFRLFNKHIPRYEDGGTGKNIALIDISSIEVEMSIIDLNPKATYWLFDNKYNYDMLALMCPDADIKSCCASKITEDSYNILKDKNMKFDCVIGNPPYDRDMHLRILNVTQKYVNFDNGGEIIWLHPSKWIKRFDYWKNRWNVFPVESITEVGGDIATQLFGAGIGSNLIVTKLSKRGTYDYIKFSRFIPWVKSKIIDVAPEHLKNCSAKVNTNGHQWQLNMPIVHGHIGCADMEEITSKVYERALNVKFGKRPQDVLSYAFNSEIERRNFYNSLFTKFIRFIIVTCRDGQTAASAYYAIPFMQDYTQPWTDERFYKFFDLTPDEIKLIEDTVK